MQDDMCRERQLPAHVLLWTEKKSMGLIHIENKEVIYKWQM